jgi:hypothetical protein
VISESQELSRTIATSLSHLAVHNPIPKWHGLISGVALLGAGTRAECGYSSEIRGSDAPDRVMRSE